MKYSELSVTINKEQEKKKKNKKTETSLSLKGDKAWLKAFVETEICLGVICGKKPNDGNKKIHG